MAETNFITVLVNQGDEMAEQNNYDGAIVKYHRAIRMEPQNSDIRKKLIDVCKRKNSYREAISEYINWAEVCKKVGNYEQAIDVFQECLDIGNPGSERLSTQSQTAKINETLEACGGEIYWKLGLLYLTKNDLKDAETAFRESLKRKPSNTSEIHKQLGVIYTRQGRLHDAIVEYNVVLDLVPEDISVCEQIGELYYSKQEEINAIQWFTYAGDLYFQKNDLIEAGRVYKNILKFDPENADILAKLRNIYPDEGLLEKNEGNS